MKYVYVHGGVSGTKRDALPSLADALVEAMDASIALDAVERAVRWLEDNPALNAGWGATITLDGNIELEAGIADGLTGRCGAVANVSVRHPVSLARRVMEQTPHVLVSGAGAQALGADMELLSDTTAEKRAGWEKARREGRLGPAHYGATDHVDTVGAVALDTGLGLAAASSTGGVFGKLPGRIGDSPLFGAGFYASAAAAVVGTGVGELFVETLASFRTGALIEAGGHPQEACEEIIGLLGRRNPTPAGLLALDQQGRAGAAFRGGSWAVEGIAGAVDPVRID